MTVDREQVIRILERDGVEPFFASATADELLSLPDPVADAARELLVAYDRSGLIEVRWFAPYVEALRAALDAAVNGGKQDAENPRYFVDPPMAGH